MLHYKKYYHKLAYRGVKMKSYLKNYVLGLGEGLVMLALLLTMLDLTGMIHLANVRVAYFGW